MDNKVSALMNTDMFQLFGSFPSSYTATSSASVLFFVVQGNIEIEIGEKKAYYSIDDFFILNRGSSLDIKLLGDKTVICLVYIPTSIVRETVGTNNYYFECDSVAQSSMNHEEIRNVVKGLVSLFNQTQLHTESINTALRIKSVYFSLIDIVIRKHLVMSDQEVVTSDRFLQTLNFIHNNYFRKLTLQEVADYCYMSESYFSRFFKKEMGINFVNYLRDYRVKQSLSLLIETDRTITQIALDVGFSSTSSYNVAFKDTHDSTPTEYRNKATAKPEVKQELVEIDSLTFNESIFNFEFNNEEVEYGHDTFDNKSEKKVQLSINDYMNVGHVKNLMDGNFQEHLKILSRGLSLRGVIVSNVFDTDTQNHDIDFSRSSYRYVYDYIIENDFNVIFQVPFLDSNIGSIQSNVERFLKYLLSNFNPSSLSKVHFNFQIDLSSKNLTNLIDSGKATIGVIRRLLRGAEIGAPDLNLYNLNNFIEHNQKIYALDIDFVTCTYSSRAASRVHVDIAAYMDKIKSTMSKKQYDICITNYNTSDSKNFVHDSILKAAQVVNDLIKIQDKVSFLAYAPISDLLLEHINKNTILDGGNGLLTSRGLYKPVFFAFKFMRHMGDNFLHSAPNYLASRVEGGNLTILAHNFNEKAKSKEILEPFTVMKNTERLNDSKSKVISLSITGMEDGIYEIRSYNINHSTGSVLNEWSKWNFIEYYRTSDIDHLKNMGNPKLMIETVQVTGSKLFIDLELASNEISIKYIDRVKI